MGRGIDSLLRWLTRSGMRRAMSGEHWAWFVVGGAAFFLRRARRRDDRAAQIHLRSGDRYVIEVHDGAGGGNRRGQRRRGRRPQGSAGTPQRVIWRGERITAAADRPE